MSEEKDEIQIACDIAVELWNRRNKHYQVTLTPKRYLEQGGLIVVDAVLGFNKYTDMQILDGNFTIASNTAWDDPMEFVYGWLECIEESYHLIYE
ncbi:hypothetical protein [Salmonella phage STP-4]|uniref:Uncharacterized protein n=3 Tax=Kuttervirus TaxID=2169536 RepID=A0A1W5PUV8_9CAUD|nr:hypothetical protein SFP_0092 [Salmonella phage SFP10]AEN94187.1 hypothetical protein SFP_0092 [Salmonella phage SFP10]APD18399.1 hypothetical protein STP07_132 [Salmonella phage STP07]QIQ62147.1 hypothetical protein kage_79 [Salmonella phage kage]UGL60313.1 hypothetical protein [Salmonella phage vB_SenAc-pSC20]